MRIARLEPGDDHVVHAGAALFDDPPTSEATARFLDSPGHHILVALHDEQPVGFVTGVEMTHPDKGTEMFLYELSVGEEHRRQGVGTALCRALETLARERGCHGMWVGTEPDNAPAIATYRAAGAPPPETAVIFTWTFS
jgi:ribosomal protein S18 acetylase RimI-like enzyme